MSIDISLKIDTGRGHMAEVVEVGNYTHNCQPMWTLALNFSAANIPPAPKAWWGNMFGKMHLCSFDGIKAADAIPILDRAVSHMDDPDNYSVYETMNPSNGWGEFSSARDYLWRFLVACQENPLCTIDVSC